MNTRRILATTIFLTGCISQPPAPPPLPEAGTEAGQIVPESISDEDESYFLSHQLMVPVDGVTPKQLRNTFNEARDGGRTHRATDILAPRGTPVVAAISGEVARMSQNTLGGVTVYLTDDEKKYVYYYAHLDHYSDALTPGLKVSDGDVIGYVGTSGNAPPDTPHLHFQAMRINPGQHDWWNGTPVDVRLFMTRTGKARE
ncbi:MAG: M23 family metallopeptidase [Gemmatimonadaceae bacterium]